MSQFLRELNHRYVLRTAVIYAVAGLAVIEFTDIVSPLFGIGLGVQRTLILLVLFGWPVALLLAWGFEVGSEGLRRRPPIPDLRRTAVFTFGLFLVVTGLAGWGLTVRVEEDPVALEAAVHEAAEAFMEFELHTPEVTSSGESVVVGTTPMRAVRLGGIVKYARGVEEVRIDGRRASLNRGTGSEVLFSGFLVPEEGDALQEVEILAVGVDGRRARRTVGLATPTFGSEPQVPRTFGEFAMARDRTRWVVIVGVSDYQDEHIADLQYAAADAKAFYDFLTSEKAGLGGIPDGNIQFLLNEDATSQNIRSAIGTFLRRSTPDDVIVVYLAAHGTPDPNRPEDMYILTHESTLDDIAATALSLRHLNEALAESYAYQKIILADVTHSAGLGAGSRLSLGNPVHSGFLNGEATTSGGFVAFTASEPNALSLESEGYGGGHGVFTYFLLRALEGAADDNGDGVVTLREAMEWTRDLVRRETRNAQIPTMSSTSYDPFWPMAEVGR